MSDDTVKLEDLAKIALLQEFTLEEKKRQYNTQKSDSAPGLDKVTNLMLKNLSDTCLTFIVDLYNDIQIAAEIPISWKKDKTLLLKKAPATLLKNY